jgi:hypothetical protein
MDPTFESVRTICRLASACSAIALGVCWLAPAGHASQLIARDARAVSLQVDARGRALVTTASRTNGTSRSWEPTRSAGLASPRVRSLDRRRFPFHNG